jgi:hypothetical protein
MIRQLFAATDDVIEEARRSVPRCLTTEEREKAYLNPEPPVWCIRNEKRPYHTGEWKQWLGFRGQNTTVPLPSTKEWDEWRGKRVSSKLSTLPNCPIDAERHRQAPTCMFQYDSNARRL